MKIAFFETDSSEQEYFTKALAQHELAFSHKILEDSDIPALAQTQALCTFIYSSLSKERLQTMPALKLIVTRSTGYDHIDLKYCARAGITVCNVPKYGGTAVAEHTLGLMIALARNIPQAVENTYHDDFSLENLEGFELKGKTLGIVGVGTIGQSVARIGCALGMNVLGYERTPDPQKAAAIGYTEVSFKELLKSADIISLHVPYSKETHHLIDKSAFKYMKKGSFLINTARGPLVDTNALVWALDEGILAGVALDVLEGEADLREAHQPLKETHFFSHNWKTIRTNHALLKRKNVLITPHMAFYTREALETIHSETCRTIESFAQGTIANQVK